MIKPAQTQPSGLGRNHPRTKATRAKVMAPQPNISTMAATKSNGTEYFHVCTISLNSARRSWRRVSTNSFISSLVSARTAPSDFSLFTVSPPYSQAHTNRKPERSGEQRDVQRILADHAICADSGAVISHFDARSEL